MPTPNPAEPGDYGTGLTAARRALEAAADRPPTITPVAPPRPRSEAVTAAVARARGNLRDALRRRAEDQSTPRTTETTT